MGALVYLSGRSFIFALPLLMLRYGRVKTEVKVGGYATFATGPGHHRLRHHEDCLDLEAVGHLVPGMPGS
ncbi:uncharacterized protein PgNI_02300 [Pyricularia grisea]|uniref:Uncharacterized protein n=1 Tax=Pyricularia grisea TaxID=148305 RepID=A0A6P8BFA1_PYRGI|nr:uncharacterized protein PgNI_02300 [Pyricularia grisea]TLD15501.1 hypothetical protein PgNI_02300 [Pyricularia grisea]